MALISGSRAPYLVALLLWAGVTLALILFNASGYSWQDWEPNRCQPDHCFCEALRDGPVMQPSNTYSNLGFVLVGLIIAVPALARLYDPAIVEVFGKNLGAMVRLCRGRGALPVVAVFAACWTM